MLNLYLGSAMSIVTTAAVLLMLVLIVLAVTKRASISKWGRLILLFVVVGTAISAFSATRDAYMTESALFAPMGLQAAVCAVAGGLIFLTGIVSIFVRKQSFRKAGFHIMSALFLVQVATVEISRIALL